MNETVVIHIRNSLPGDVYIGRAGQGQDGYFGNPITKSHRCPKCKRVHTTGEETLPCYREYFLARIAVDATFRERVRGLRGKRLVCFCKPKHCHGDVIVDWLENDR